MLKRFIKYVTQSVAGMIGISIYVLADTFFISVYSGADGLAQGAQPLISESYGKGESAQVRKLLKWSLSVCLAVEALIQLVIWTATDPLINIFNSENNIQLLNYAHIGMRLYFLGFLIAGINVVLVAYFSAVDEPKIAIAGSMMRGVVAIVICAIVLAKLFGLNGVWISLLASEAITFLMILILAYKDRNVKKSVKGFNL